MIASNKINPSIPLLPFVNSDIQYFYNFISTRYYPPGSGEVFTRFIDSGLLDKFREMGKDYLFICNVENLGANADVRK